jgi:hypothetical protein
MDYASFVIKGRVVWVKEFEICIQVSNREVICKGHQLKHKCKPRDHIMAHGFIDKRTNYIIEIVVS